MAKKIKLSEVVDELTLGGPETVVYLDRRTGRFYRLNDDVQVEASSEMPIEKMADWIQEDVAVARAIEEGNDESLVALPTQFDVDEYRIMEAFCQTYSDRRVSGRLCDAIRGKGAFGRFKRIVHEAGIEVEWHSHHDQELAEIVREWCVDNEIPYVDDRTPHLHVVDESEAVESRVEGLLSGERDAIANAANLAAEVFQSLERINWCGFYFLKCGKLVLGPFQGKPACTTISLERGVCGAVATRRETLVVADVHEFPGHIACDEASRSEVVVPILCGGRLIGVFDVDSPERGRFGERERLVLERLVEIYVASSDLDGFGEVCTS